jgi:four helix bundle suffix protein
MSDPSDQPDPLLPHGGYRKLRSYKVAEVVYDATVVFCRRFYPHDRRQTDQMVQAARSGVRNISEGSGAAATSRKSEMKLTNVARASLSDELIGDYESFLSQNGLRIWPKDSPEALAMRARLVQDKVPNLPPAKPGKVRLTGLFGLSDFVARAEPELAANAMLCAVNQAAYLLKRQLESQSRTFLEKGGFTEKLYDARSRAKRSAKPDSSDQAAAPLCPRCGKPMRQRTARQGAHAGQSFWGCSGYPDCKGTRPIDLSDKSAPSDKRP